MVSGVDHPLGWTKTKHMHVSVHAHNRCWFSSIFASVPLEAQKAEMVSLLLVGVIRTNNLAVKVGALVPLDLSSFCVVLANTF